MQDLWATPNVRAKKWEHHENQKKKQMPIVKAVIKPMEGQSFNPSASAHKGVLAKVINEEKADIEKAKKEDIYTMAIPENKYVPGSDSESESEDSDKEEGGARYQPNSEKRKTKKQKRKQREHKERLEQAALAK